MNVQQPLNIANTGAQMIAQFLKSRLDKSKVAKSKPYQPFTKLPVSTLTGKPIIHFAHANGMPSACYQPLFDTLADEFTVVTIAVMGADIHRYPVDNHWQRLTQQIIDSVSKTCKEHGVSSVIGLGHSLGALCTLQATYRCPQYFSQAILLDPPIIYGQASFVWHMAKLSHQLLGVDKWVDNMSPAGKSKYRRDVWDSRQHAYDSLRHKALFKKFDERCFQNYIEHGLVERADGKVTLLYPKSREVAVFRTNPSWFWLTPNSPPAIPVGCIIGEDSEFLRHRFPQKLQKRLGIAFVTHQGDHMFPLQHPESVANQLKQQIRFSSP